MYPRSPYPSNIQTSTPSLGGTLELTGGNPDLPKSTRTLYRPIQTSWTIFVPILFGSPDAETTGTFVPLHLICTETTQILGLSHSEYIG